MISARNNYDAGDYSVLDVSEENMNEYIQGNKYSVTDDRVGTSASRPPKISCGKTSGGTGSLTLYQHPTKRPIELRILRRTVNIKCWDIRMRVATSVNSITRRLAANVFLTSVSGRGFDFSFLKLFSGQDDFLCPLRTRVWGDIGVGIHVGVRVRIRVWVDFLRTRACSVRLNPDA